MPRNDDDFDPKKCLCGSGLEKDAEYDARGIFLTYACDKCRETEAGQLPLRRFDRSELLGRRGH